MEGDNPLEERRRKNIERNQQFLLQLFASQRDPASNNPSFDSPNHNGTSTSLSGRLSSSSSSKRRLVTNCDDEYEKELQHALKREKRDFAIQQKLNTLYPERSLQIQQLSEYLTISELLCGDEFTTIVAYGPSGGGKSCIFSDILHEHLGEQRVVHVNCRLLSTVQDLLWTVQTSIAKYLTDVYRLKKLPIWKLGRTYSVIDLANFLRTAIVLPMDEEPSTTINGGYRDIYDPHDASVISVALFLDNVSHIMDYESIFASLADLSRISERRFQLFATLEVAPATTNGMLPTNFVHFPAYSLEQLRNIVSRRIVAQAKWSTDLDGSNNHQENNSKNRTSTNTTSVSVAIAEEHCRLCHQRLQLLLLQSMETLSLASHSINLLTSAMSSLWLVLYGETPANSYRKHKHSIQSDNTAVSTSTNYTSDNSNLLPVFGQAFVKRVLQEMIRRNRFNFYAHHNVHNQQQQQQYDPVYVELRNMVLQHAMSTSTAVGSTSDNSTALTSNANNGNSNNSDNASTNNMLYLAQFTASSNRMASLPLQHHVQALPFHLRVILVAAFLAGHRGKQQDALYDPSSQSFKRRRHSQQHGDNNNHNSNSSNGEGNHSGSNNNTSSDVGAGVLQTHAHGQSLMQSETHLPNRELFTYERLSALFAHVLTYCSTTQTSSSYHTAHNSSSSHKNNNYSYGNNGISFAKPTLQSLVTRLEMYGLLQAMPTVLPVYHPQRRLHCGYRANIAKQLASAAAENIGFPLDSFIYSSYDFHHPLSG